MNVNNPYQSPLQSGTSLEKNRRWVYSLRQAILNVLIIVPITAFLVTCIGLVFERKFLKCDDPFIFGAWTALMTGYCLTIFHATQALKEFRKLRASIYVGTTVVPALCYIGYDCFVHLPEGQGIHTVLGVAMIISNLLSIPLRHIRVSKPLICLAGMWAFFYGTGYAVTIYSMHR